MNERVWSEKDLLRRAKRRLAVLQHAEEVSGNVAATCRYYGISRTVFYRWKRRYEDAGLDGLKDRSSAPMHCPNTTQPEVVGKIIHLRQHYHFGPMKITMYLQRYHDITISTSGVWRILKRLDMSRLPASQRHKRREQRWKRYEKQRPGHHVQIDVKFIEPITTGPVRRKRYYQWKGASPARIALAWLLAQLPWIVPIPGTRRGGPNRRSGRAAEAPDRG